jgi:hypothetical protein
MRAGLVVLLCVACGSGRTPVRIGHGAGAVDPTPPPATETTPTAAPAPPPRASIRIIHAAVESRDASLSITANGDSSTLAGPTGFQFASTYGALEPGTHALSVQSGGQELIGASLELAAGFHTVVVYSTADFPAALAAVPDSAAEWPAETSGVRFFHAIVGTTAIDVCAADGHPLFPAVNAGTFGDATGGYGQVPSASELSVQLRARHATPCHGRMIGVASFTPASGNNYTLVAVGRTRGRRVPLELIFCADPPATDTSCATLTLSPH